MKAIAILLLLTPLVTSANSQTLEGKAPIDYKQTNFQTTSTTLSSSSQYPAHSGKSPKPFDKIRIPSGTFIVADTGVDNDVYKYRDDTKEYDFSFELKIDRYVGNVALLKENDLISETFKVIIPAFDVDPNGGEQDCDGDDILESVYPEINQVYFNGELIGTLQGNDNLWELSRNTFTLPIEKLNVPTQVGERTTNLVQIKSDTANKDVPLSGGGVGCKVWATEIDYVAIDFDLVDPVVFLAGLSGNQQAFVDSNFQEALAEDGIPSDVIGHSINAQIPFSDPGCSNTPISFRTHAEEFKEQIKSLSIKYRTNTFNLVAHSKSGLDSRWLVNDTIINHELVETGTLDGTRIKNPLKFNSIASLGTPFEGSVAATAMRYGRIPMGHLIIEFETDYCDLDVGVSTIFSYFNPFPDDMNFLAIGADIDIDNDGVISEHENVGNQIPFLPLSQQMYDLLKDTMYIGISGYTDNNPYCYDPFGSCVSVKLPVISEVIASEPQYNDTSVTVNSALPYDADLKLDSDGNHGTIVLSADPEQPQSGMQDTVKDEGINGMLQWRTK
ncbi:esterase/lipase family protein [Kangiella koreensis]|uniref:Uncharacterized protein n=1 Tax=Kangiella koreensis (strain DSM 16069 / JCM 12317 / KCTC 12182 / SW-125) TaxID=523791 RepID=C7R631_KANKD|nr:hypothetical protein [Kangiella koreensis]ACV25462.1 conserved hypothetical protein [Kangiella koreensis DSM 16069]